MSAKKLTRAQRRKRITALIEKWRQRLFLGEWHIDHEYKSCNGPDGHNGWSASAEIYVNYPYKQAKIITYDGFWSESSDNQCAIIAHELCHCHTEEAWSMIRDLHDGKLHTPDAARLAIETLTQRISIIAKYG